MFSFGHAVTAEHDVSGGEFAPSPYQGAEPVGAVCIEPYRDQGLRPRLEVG